MATHFKAKLALVSRAGSAIGEACARTLPVTGLVASAALLAVAPGLMPASYDWIAHTTSESAAQGIEAGWVARLGFTVFGVSVIALATSAPPAWNCLVRASHFVFRPIHDDGGSGIGRSLVRGNVRRH